jgi:hypothetical protein
MDYEYFRKFYPKLSVLGGLYFGEDFDIFGDTLDEVFSYYLETENEHEIIGLRKEFADWLSRSDEDIDQMVKVRFDGMDVVPWGNYASPRAFCEDMVRRLDVHLKTTS